MRDLQVVSPERFNAFVAAYTPPLQAITKASIVYYVDNSSGDEWPENLVASFLPPSPPKRSRARGHRIPVEN